MFTGIIQAKGKVFSFTKQDDIAHLTLVVSSDFIESIQLGASVSTDGVCLSVTSINTTDNHLSFDIIHTTLEITSLGNLEINQEVNIERSFKTGDEVGGHIISGHVSETAEIFDIIRSGNQVDYWFTISDNIDKYIFDKGFIGIDGMSLTIADKEENSFMVSLIPDTLERTTISQKSVGDFVNIEIDNSTRVMVDTVERLLPQYIDKN